MLGDDDGVLGTGVGTLGFPRRENPDTNSPLFISSGVSVKKLS